MGEINVSLMGRVIFYYFEFAEDRFTLFSSSHNQQKAFKKCKSEEIKPPRNYCYFILVVIFRLSHFSMEKRKLNEFSLHVNLQEINISDLAALELRKRKMCR